MTGPVIAALTGLGLYGALITCVVVYMVATASGKAAGSHTHHREDLRAGVRPPAPERAVPAGPVAGTGPELGVELAHDDPRYRERIVSGLALLTPALPALPPMIAAGKPDETAIEMTAIGDEP